MSLEVIKDAKESRGRMMGRADEIGTDRLIVSSLTTFFYKFHTDRFKKLNVAYILKTTNINTNIHLHLFRSALLVAAEALIVGFRI